ncbi:MAG: hydroxyquinol 1,2-dioxygenase, partial [Deltaproteobacteria bacterium]
MRNLTEANLTEAVLARTVGCEDARTRRILQSIIRHLHAIVREVEPTPEEWLAAIRFLTETGQMCDEKRQEFILLSDTLGISMLVDAINNRMTAGGTESSVL